ncbi:MAG: metallophosphoesterase family protein [Planctomycetota bacterium]|nr:metallophosphoesterase family protein [Planctomycetota bacterium]
MARIGVISDIHSNANAFMVVLNELGRQDVDEIFCLGDIVGYGPAPARCLELAFTYCDILVRGNHDEAVFDEWAHRKFNPVAWAAIEWTRKNLTERDVDSLVHMKPIEISSHGVTCAHDTPQEYSTAYVLDATTAAEAFISLETPIGLLGHTHIPRVFTVPEEALAGGDCPTEAINIINPVPGEPISIPDHHWCLCNPGAVGQPRDADPRASWAILDTEARTFTVHRTDYDIKQTIIETKEAGLPEILGSRLMEGL